MSRIHQKLPPSGPKREALREKGQFWTPQWVAEAMVTYALSNNSDHIFDPAVGAGAFFIAAKNVSRRISRNVRLFGTEIDGQALTQARAAGLNEDDLSATEVRDFVLNGPDRRFSAIVANPPYIRHHRISTETKEDLRLLTKRILGKTLDGRTGYHIFFFIKALERLSPGGRLAFIMPADTCEGVFADTLWKWVLDTYRVDAVVTFSHDATPFPSVDTNAVIFMISAEPPGSVFKWCRCTETGQALPNWVESGFPIITSDTSIAAFNREIGEGLATGLSRPPQERHTGPVLGDFARTMRGIASGANDFFFMTAAEASGRDLPLSYFVRAVGRTRDVEGDEITLEHLDKLDADGRPTYLLSLNSDPIETLPDTIRRYLQQGDAEGLPKSALISQRKPWYKMEKREPPPYLFAYLGRRNTRFIRNRAGVVPLTGFLCVYPRNAEMQDSIWRLLNHPETIANLSRVAKSYGSGAIKVEPRALERVPLSEATVRDSGLIGIPAPK
jgi:adenine-specific DNA-methyltransferase